MQSGVTLLNQLYLLLPPLLLLLLPDIGTSTGGAAAAPPGGHLSITVEDEEAPPEPAAAIDKPRKRLPGLDDLQHPLLGEEPTLRLLPDRSQIKGG